jgi:hypothetical protein
LCVELGFYDVDQGASGTKPFPDVTWWLAGGGKDLDDECEIRFAVLPSKRTGLGYPCDAVLINLINKEAVLWDVIEGSNQDNAAWGNVQFFHDYALRKKRSGSTKPRVSPKGIGKGSGFRKSGSKANPMRAKARACGTASDIAQRFLSCHSKTSRRAPPAIARDVNDVSIGVLHDDFYHYRGREMLSFVWGSYWCLHCCSTE